MRLAKRYQEMNVYVDIGANYEARDEKTLNDSRRLGEED